MKQKKYAVVEIFGRQYKVSEGDRVEVSLSSAPVGSHVTFDKIFLLNDGQSVKLGTPLVGGASVNAEVVSHGRKDKVIVFKYLRKNKSKKLYGHRQPFTTLSIKEISG